ncbi:MAG: YciI family protein [Roseitalea porphyridii]|jgi:hypothetical protein|uniref:YciI family protein n=1 Tax=Roseitalea porphyridii TaxID=1852022 RepID=UPI0032EC8B1C
MQYMIMNYVRPDEFVGEGTPDNQPKEAWKAYTQAMIDAGVMVEGNALHPAHTATTVRLRDGQREIADGPYADTKEHLGGYYIIEVPDLDTALDWAARNPAAGSGAVEVRPVVMR